MRYSPLFDEKPLQVIAEHQRGNQNPLRSAASHLTFEG
jgi:hypothetical protein